MRRSGGQAFGRSGGRVVGSLGRRFLCVLCGFILSSGCLADLRAGAAKVSITPDPKAVKYTLGGYGDPSRLTNPATGVHDACYSRALVLENGGVKAAIVSLDLCYLPENVKAEVDRRIAASGFKPDSVLLCATHSHSAPEPLMLHSRNDQPAGILPRYDPALTSWIADRIAQSITEANGKLQFARIGSGQMQGLGLNRNRRGEQITDDEMTALKVTDSRGKVTAAVVNYAAHPVYYGAEMLQVSGDWSGTFQRVMEAGLPDATVLFVNGAEGDASPNGSDAGTNAEKIDIYAAKLALPTRKLLESIQPAANPSLSAWQESFSLPARQPNPLFLLAAARLKATPDQAREFVNRLMPESTRISFLRVGDTLLMGCPGEPTTPIGLEAKRIARERGILHPAVVALTNAWLGYLVTEQQYKAGKYEPTMSFYGPGIGAAIIAGIKSGLARIPSR